MKILASLRSFLIAPLLLVMMGVTGCNTIFEELPECETALKFRYDYNMSGEDLFAAQVEAVKVFVFGRDGGYVQTLSESGDALRKAGYRMEVPSVMKGCTMVVWAGRTERCYSLPQMKTGDPIGNLVLKYEPAGAESAAHLDPLWHAGPTDMTFSEENGTVQTVNLTRITNDVTLSVSRANALVGMDEFEVGITAADGVYDHEGRRDEQAQEIVYRSCSDECQPDERFHSRFHIMRLDSEEDALLSVTKKSYADDAVTGQDFSINLTDYLLKAKPEGMTAGEYLDRRYEWDVNLSIEDDPGGGFVAVSITINGWTYWFNPTELQ